MKKYLVIAGGILGASVTMAAMPVYQPIGSSFTLGSATNQRSLSTSLSNPAAPFLMVNSDEKDSFRFGILGPLGVGYEAGDVSDLNDRVDDLQDLLDKQYTTGAQAEAARVSANKIINEIGQKAYVKVSGGLQVPLMPIIYKTKGSGAFMLDASVSVVGKATVISDDIVVSGNELVSDTSFYVKAAKDIAVGLGYSRPVWTPESGQLIAGVKANFHRISFGRQLAVLTDESEDAGDVASDAFSDDLHSSSGVGLDLGLIWAANYYQLGLTLANLNEPEFDYGDLGSCGGLSGTSLNRCNTANKLAAKNKLNLSETYTMEAQSTLEAAVSTKNRRWTLASSYDVNSVKDPIGDEYQWGVVSASYYGDSHWLPGVRFGYRKNMAGSELSYATAGLTFLKRLNLDIAYGLETVKDKDGDELPRSAYISLGYDTAF